MSGVTCITKLGWQSRTGLQGELVDAFEGLAHAPGKGHRRPDLTSRDVLFVSVYRCT